VVNQGQISLFLLIFFACYLRSGRRGRRFESCHSDHSHPKLVLIAGGSQVNSLGQTPGASLRFRDAIRVRAMPDSRPSKNEGAGNAGCVAAPMARLQQKTQAAVTTGQPQHRAAFPAQWFYGL
jgi:hypothetical protein